MTSYVQTTIHSKIAKQEKTTSEGLGSLVRGRVLPDNSTSREKTRQLQIAKQIQILPKSKVNISRRMRNKVIPSLKRGEQIVLMQSGVFPAIYFKKTTMRNVLKQFVFPEDVHALPPSDDRTPLIFQIISNLFNEISFYIFNILIGENTVTGSFYIFFSDSETIPFTKCCNAPVYVELQSNGSGKILCNALKCPHANIAEFLINFEDGKKLWTNITYFSEASDKDRELRAKISKIIVNGKHRKVNLVQIVQDTSKEIVDIFYSMKKQPKQEEHQETESPFITAQLSQPPAASTAEEARTESLAQLLTAEDNNIDMLKMKIGYMVKQEKDLGRRIAKSIVDEGKVFHKNFDMIKKIDEFMLTQKSSKHGTKVNFPRLMDQLRKTRPRQGEGKARTVSAYHSFT